MRTGSILIQVDPGYLPVTDTKNLSDDGEPGVVVFPIEERRRFIVESFGPTS